MDSQTYQELVSSLKALDTHMTYLREEVSKIASLQEAFQELQLNDVQRTSELSSLREAVETLVLRIDGPDKSNPLPSRVKTLEDRVLLSKINDRVQILENSVQIHKTQLSQLETNILELKKEEKELKREKIKAKWQTVGAVVAAIGSVVAALIAMLS